MDYEYSGHDNTDKQAEAPKVLVREGGESVAKGQIHSNEAAFQAYISDKDDINATARHSGMLGVSDAGRLMFISQSINIESIHFSFEALDDSNWIEVKCAIRTKERGQAETPALLGCAAALVAIASRIGVMDRELSIDGIGLIRS